MSGFLRGWVGTILIALLIATSIKSSLADWYVVPTGSMKPNIVEGDRIFTNKLAYDLKVPYTTIHVGRWADPQRGHIVVFKSSVDGKSLVKRVIGLPGDRIEMKDNVLMINGKAIEYEPLLQKKYEKISTLQGSDYQYFMEDLDGRRHPMIITPDQQSIRSFDPVDVPEGKYFMMGDNRDNSQDSRYFGFVDRERILGRAIAIVISLDYERHYRPRTERFFTKLP
ncbi:MAG: signal peptidase I [Deltaproteobacteria bacterium]|nr:signal peptidase I [Deltaproteobacteria bacterium]